MPADNQTLILLLGREQKVYAYIGKDINNRIATKEGKINSILTVVKTKLNKDFSVIIKPSPTAAYKDVVDALDQMLVKKVKRYVIEEITSSEEVVLKNVQ
jgi:hypothetical protein